MGFLSFTAIKKLFKIMTDGRSTRGYILWRAQRIKRASDFRKFSSTHGKFYVYVASGSGKGGSLNKVFSSKVGVSESLHFGRERNIGLGGMNETLHLTGVDYLEKLENSDLFQWIIKNWPNDNFPVCIPNTFHNLIFV